MLIFKSRTIHNKQISQDSVCFPSVSPPASWFSLMGDNGAAAAALGDDTGIGMQCTDHPYGGSHGGICAFCLQEKLGKLVSPKTNPFFPLPHSSPSSSPPSLRPSSAAAPPSLTKTAGAATTAHRARTQIPFLSGASSRKVMASSSTTSSSSASSVVNGGSAGYNNVLVLQRSKSVAPKPLRGLSEAGSIAADSPRKKSFWSFLSVSHSVATSATAATGKRRSTSFAAAKRDLKHQQVLEENGVENKKAPHMAVVEAEEVAESPGGSQASSRKVSRSRSVGCGSRSFSGDFLERISFGDCTLRRVESHREAKHKAGGGGTVPGEYDEHHHRIRCGGLFGGFGMISSSASSSYWLSAAADEFDNNVAATARMSTSAVRAAGTPHGRSSRSWAWASLASPMRAFKPATTTSSKPYVAASTTVITSTAGSGKVGANPSILAVGS